MSGRVENKIAASARLAGSAKPALFTRTPLAAKSSAFSGSRLRIASPTPRTLKIPAQLLIGMFLVMVLLAAVGFGFFPAR